MYIEICHFHRLCEVHKENIIEFISEVTKEIHNVSIKNGGFIL